MAKKIGRIVLFILTLITTLFFVFGVVWGFALSQPIMSIVCLMLAAGFGLFVYRDIKYFVNNDEK